MKTPRLLLALCFLGLAIAGCKCDQKTTEKFPKLELPNADMSAERTTLDFGQVQVNIKSVRKISIRNAGNTALTVDKVTTAAPFGIETPFPLTIEVNEKADLAVSFTPTEPDQRIIGKLNVTSNDPARPSADLSLAGTGVNAVAKISPNPIDFGDVYLGESKKVSVLLTNAGSDDLRVLEAAFSAGTPATLTGNLANFKSTLGAGTTTTVELTWAPTAIETLAGQSLQLTLDPMQGGTISLPIKGQSTAAVPKLCFRRDGTGMETCADVTGPSVQLPMGSFCDNALYACADGGFTGKIYVRNEGNVQVAYSMNWDSLPYAAVRCDGGSPGSDFVFSNSAVLADGGRQTKTSDATTKLPMNITDNKPWETAPVSVSYRATSHCREDGADQARVIWTRQGDPASRTPGTLFVTFNAASQLPRAVTSDWSCGTSSSPATVPCSAGFFGVNNAGDAPLTVSKIELFEEFPSGGGDAGGPNGGIFQSCTLNTPGSGSACDAFAWAKTDGGDPNQYAPHTLTASTNPAVPTQRQLGFLTFGPAGRGCVDAGAACPNTPYRVYAVVTTDDPYSPKIISKISGYGQ